MYLLLTLQIDKFERSDLTVTLPTGQSVTVRCFRMSDYVSKVLQLAVFCRANIEPREAYVRTSTGELERAFAGYDTANDYIKVSEKLAAQSPGSKALPLICWSDSSPLFAGSLFFFIQGNVRVLRICNSR